MQVRLSGFTVCVESTAAEEKLKAGRKVLDRAIRYHLCHQKSNLERKALSKLLGALAPMLLIARKALRSNLSSQTLKNWLS